MKTERSFSRERFGKDVQLRAAREAAYRARMSRARNILVLSLVGVFFLIIGIFAIVRFAVPTEEKPIELPKVTPSMKPVETPAPSATQGVVVPSVSATPTPLPTYKTENSYQSEGMTFTIEEVTKDKLVYFVVDMKIRDMSLFKSAFSGDDGALHRNIYENPVEILERNSGLLAINCDNAGYTSDGIIVRNGAVFRFAPSDRDVMLIYSDGSMKIMPEKDIKTKENLAVMVSEGLIHSFSFGPGLIIDGKPRGDYSTGFTEIGGSNPRTAVGMVEPGHFKLVIVDGRVENSSGLRLPGLEELMLELGCAQAYNLDGGQSSILIYDGNVINQITDRDEPRPVTDILYFTED